MRANQTIFETDGRFLNEVIAAFEGSSVNGKRVTVGEGFGQASAETNPRQRPQSSSGDRPNRVAGPAQGERPRIAHPPKAEGFKTKTKREKVRKSLSRKQKRRKEKKRATKG